MRRGATFPPGLYFPFIMADLRMTTAEIGDKGSNILFTLVLSPPVVPRLPRRQAQLLLINPYPSGDQISFSHSLLSSGHFRTWSEDRKNAPTNCAVWGQAVRFGKEGGDEV